MFRYLLMIVIFFTFLISNTLNLDQSLKKAKKFYIEKKYEKAFYIYKKLYDKNLTNEVVINNLAMMYYFGKGTKFDQAKAVKILKKYIKNHKNISSDIYLNLALMYWNGYIDNSTQKVYLKRKEAKKLLLKAIKLGNKKAKNFYNNFYKDINVSKKK